MAAAEIRGSPSNPGEKGEKGSCDDCDFAWRGSSDVETGNGDADVVDNNGSLSTSAEAGFSEKQGTIRTPSSTAGKE